MRRIKVLSILYFSFCLLLQFAGCATSRQKVTEGKTSRHSTAIQLSYLQSTEEDEESLSLNEGGGLNQGFTLIDQLVKPYGFQHQNFFASRSPSEGYQYATVFRNLSRKGTPPADFPLAYDGLLKKIIPYPYSNNNENFARRTLPQDLTFISQLVQPQGFQHRNFLTHEYSWEGYQYACILRNLYGDGKGMKGGTGILATEFPMVYNSSVEESLDYLRSKANFLRSSLARAEQYLPLMTSIFREHDLPEDLVYLSLIESGFNPSAYSSAGASGQWQFMKATAKRYGLRVDGWVDERRDPEKSTRAAVRYLKDLYGMFGDWYLAVTAYNAGEWKVAEAIRRYNTTDLWDLREKSYLKLESREFVPKLLAAIMIGKQPEEHGFPPLDLQSSVPLTKVHIPRSTDLKGIAEMAGLSLSELKRYNPELRSWCTPPHGDGYWIKIPESKKEVFAKNFSQNKRKLISTSTVHEHRIKPGETLYKIARKYNTKVSYIQEMNGIKNPRLIRPGQVLRIPVSPRTSS